MLKVFHGIGVCIFLLILLDKFKLVNRFIFKKKKSQLISVCIYFKKSF